MSLDKPILYILMRNDLPDHTPGKALAQCNHAGTDFMIRAAQAEEEFGEDSELSVAFQEWINETGSFGTCVVLSCSHYELISAFDRFATKCSLLSGLIVDPTYPIRNGHETIKAEVVTCGWSFVRKNESVWSRLPLY